jgi:zinc protease
MRRNAWVFALCVAAAGGCSDPPFHPVQSGPILQKLGQPPPDDTATDVATPPSDSSTPTPPTGQGQANTTPTQGPQGSGDETAGPPNPPAPTTTPPAPGPAKDVKFPAQSVSTLPNGLTVVVVEDHSLPLADAVLAFKGGAAAEPAALPGVADFTATMLKEGTLTKSKDDIASAIEFVGGDLESGAGADESEVSAHVLSKDLQMAMGLMADVAENPKFDDAAIEKIRTQMLSDLADSESNPGYLAGRQLAKAIYGDGPYSHYGATKDALGKIKKQDLAAFHAAEYLPNNAYLVIVGDVKSADAIKMATDTFGSWKKGTPATVTLPDPTPISAETVYLIDRPGSVQAYFDFGEPTIKRNSPDWPALEVANTVLGGNAAARLFTDLREKQSLTYGAYSGLSEKVGVGQFVARGQVRNEVTGQAWQAFEDHLQAIAQTAPSADEVKAAQSYLGGTFVLGLQSNGVIAHMVVDQYFFGLPNGYWDTYRSAIDKVTPDQAQAAAKKYIHADKEAVAIVGDAKVLAPVLSQYADLQVYSTDGTMQKKIARGSMPAPADGSKAATGDTTNSNAADHE